MSNETSTDTSKKFQSAKSISSDQYFGRDNNMDVGLGFHIIFFVRQFNFKAPILDGHTL